LDVTPFYLRKRYLIVLLAFFGYVNLYTLRVDLSVAIVALTENRTILNEDGSESYEQYFSWNSKERGIALGAFFYGYICTQFIGGYVASKFSGRLVKFPCQ
jgi:ACS family sodium-dependent inorganic phosphate cotransporter